MINLKHTMKENEHAYSYGLTIDCGLFHGQSVEGFASMIFYSFFILQAWWLGRSLGSQITLNHDQLWSEMVQKFAKHKREQYLSVKPKKKYKL